MEDKIKDTMDKDVDKINYMIELYFDMVQSSLMEKERLSCSKMLVDLMNLKFKYLGVGKDENVGKMTEAEVRKRLMAAGVDLKQKKVDKDG
jgi:hypothetical protein